MTRTITLTRVQLTGLALALVIISAGMSYGVLRLSQPTGSTPQSEPSEREVLYWYDPMVPSQHFDKPGKSPFMDMQLVARYADEGSQAGTVSIDPSRLQNLGIRLATVKRGDLALDLRAAGILEFNQRDVAIVQARADGFVQRVYARAPGDIVKAGAPLAEILVPSWAAAQSEYLAVRRANDPAIERAARHRLTLLGMSEGLIEQVARTGKPHTVVSITTPIGGAIQTLEVRQGMTVTSGQTLAQISGLSTVWLNASVPEAMAAQVSIGQRADAELTAFPGEVFNGRISAILPATQSETRTLSVRVELPNAGGRLRLGMYANVHFQGNASPALLVPSEAVLRTGTRSLVMVSKGSGRFMPVEIQIGREDAGQTEVLAGLAEGDQVVASGQFLIDSEASLAGIAAKPLMTGEASQPASKEMAIYQASGRIESLSNDRVTLSHGPISALEWPAMTMAFKLASPALAKGMKVGDRVDFSFVQGSDGPVVQTMRKGGSQ